MLPLLVACTTDVNSPDGWAGPVRAREFTILQEKPGELVAVRLGSTDNPGTPDTDERVAWRFPGDADVDLDAVYADPILDGNTLYVAGYSGEVVALDLSFEPPRIIWLRDLDETIIATPAFDGQTLYIGTEAGAIVPITVASGAVGAPIAQAGERIWSEVLLEDGALYVAALDKRVRAIRPGGGTIWAQPTELSGAVPGDTAIEGGLLVVGSFDRRLHALDADTGAEEWAFDGDGWFWARPVIAGDTVYAASTRGSIYALNAGGGDSNRVRWHFNQLDSEIRAAPVLARGVLVVAAEEATIWGIDPATGDLRWSAPLPGHRFLANPLVLDSSLIYATTRGDLVEIDPQSGRAAILYERR